jgi:hypothetical protein
MNVSCWIFKESMISIPHPVIENIERSNSFIICFLNKTQLKTQVRAGHINRKDIRIQIHG